MAVACHRRYSSSAFFDFADGRLRWNAALREFVNELRRARAGDRRGSTATFHPARAKNIAAAVRISRRKSARDRRSARAAVSRMSNVIVDIGNGPM
jgi:hypothetical protein